SQAAAVAAIVSAANAVSSALDDAGRAKLQFAFADNSQRQRWSNLPGPMFQREGLRMGDLNATQRAAVMKLLETALSANGYRKVNDIMRGDEVLKTTGGGVGPGPGPGGQGGGRRGGRGGPGGRPGGPGGGGGGVNFGEDQYYLAFLGAPSTT